jgi:two-component system LytT family response regulator
MRVLIVDDEPLARRGLRRQLERLPGVEIAGECATGAEAVQAIGAERPDLVLLDVQMPGLSGFDVIERVGTTRMPPVVFVTAYDQYAVRAFEVSALDYLLKPVDPDRLRDAVDRAADRARTGSGAALVARLEQLLARLERVSPDASPGAPSSTERLAVDEGGRIAFVERGAIDWVEAAGNYVRVHEGSRTYVQRTTMRAMMSLLGAGFVRIRRSALVNVQAIRALEPYGKGSWVVRLRSGERLISSRHFAAELRAAIRELP